MIRHGVLVGLLAVLITTTSWADEAGQAASTTREGTQGISARSPADAMATIKVKPGFHVELVASEPLIQSPVAVSFGHDGRLWVAEMHDYPAGLTGKYEPGGRVRCLYDDNGDGRYDRSELFLEGIPFPTGVTVWNKGVLVCAAPDILYAEDTNGDGKADIVRKLFTGFSTNNFHSRVNSLEYGLDGWVYGACGGFGLSITSHVTKKEFGLGRRDFRMNPDTGAFEAVSGGTQQGRVRNDWNDWFGCNNLILLQHYPFVDAYLKRNPYLKLPPAVVQIAAGPDPGRLFSIAEQVRFKLSGPPNRPTAVCGIGFYRDNLLGPDYAGNVFSCESVANLVHRQILVPKGPTFDARRGADEADCEFMASTDPWFRPVQARTGPDGGLWIVDMYRYVIEHPIWIPPETLSTLDVRAGHDMGRIYRIVKNGVPLRPVARLDRLDTEKLVAAIDTPNGAVRDLVQQVLNWRQDQSAIPLLQKLVAQAALPEVRLQALCAWSTLQQPSDAALLMALADKHPAVRRHAVRLSEPRLNDNSQVAAMVGKLAADTDPMVRMQVAYSLGLSDKPQAAADLAGMLVRDAGDAYLRAAIESSFKPANVVAVLDALKQKPETDAELIDQVYAQAAAVADVASVEALLRSLGQSTAKSPSAEHLRRMAVFLEAWTRRGKTSLDLKSAAIRTAWQPALDRAAEVAKDESGELARRLAAVQLLGQGPTLGQSQVATLVILLTPRAPVELQSAVVTSLGRHDDPGVADVLLGGWSALSPSVRKDVVPMLISRSIWTKPMLLAVEQRTLTAADFSLLQQQSLLNHSDDATRALAEKCFRSSSTSTRQEVIDRYVAGLHDRGDVARGKQVFQKHCTACHRIQEMGNLVGPDIVSYSSKPPQALLIAMMDPNQAVEPRFQSYTVALQDGRTVIGQIAEESTVGFTLLLPEGKKQSILRSEIDEMRNTGKSLMPEGFEKQVTTDDVSDLWAFVRSWRTPPKTFAGNQPKLVEVSSPRRNALLVSQAEIFGRDITFDPAHQNVTRWTHLDDFLRWKIKSPRFIEFDVWCEWACSNEAAGNPFRLELDDQVLSGKILSTGAADKYQFQKIGFIRVRDGESEVILRSGDGLKGALADVRAVHFVNRGGVPEAAGRVEFPGGRSSANAMTELAIFLINDLQPVADRERRITESIDTVAKVIPLMTRGLPESAGSPEEYRRIPWIWRVAIAIGKTKDPEKIREVLSSSLPALDHRLEHWQSVVLGGGIINGISLAGEFPLPFLTKCVAQNDDLKKRWERSLELALEMADDTNVPDGTRYDALRMCALLGWKRGGPVLIKYLPKTNEELQMAAVSGLSDIEDESVAKVLVANLVNYYDNNRGLALDALLRTDQRRKVLIQALADNKVTREQLGPERLAKLDKPVEVTVAKASSGTLAELAAFLLDDNQPQAEREKRIVQSLETASKVIPFMVKGLPEAAGSPEEYRRIPQIWRVAIAVSKTKDPEMIRELLSSSLPGPDQRLEEWQAVVLGGGIINGITQANAFPLPLINTCIGNNEELKKRWQRSLELSLAMSDDEKVFKGTRYDALRMAAMLGWQRGSPTLIKYLPATVDPELQMGAISGLSDIEDDAVGPMLLANLKNFTGNSTNTRLAINALNRTDARRKLLLKKLEN